MTDRIETQQEAEALIAGMDQLLAEPKAPVSIKEFWAQSVSASVISDYKEGRVTNV
jgi:hypothetical protein